MKNKISKLSLILIVVITIVSFTLIGCQKDDKDTSKSETSFSVVTTVGMIGDIAINVGGEFVEVTNLMGSGVDPHLYKASANDVNRLQNADLILYGGLHLEGKMSDVLKSLSATKPTVAVSEAIPSQYLIGDGDSHDPHVWFDVTLWKYAVEVVHQTLVELLPEHKMGLDKNYATYIAKLDELHTYVTDKSSSLSKEQRVLITAHDAFEYFGNAYDFEVRGLQGINTVSEVGTKDVQELSDFIVKRKIKAIFVESSVPKRTIESLQQAVKAKGFEVEIGGELFSDAFGDAGTEEGTYIGMVKHNIDTIVSALTL